MPATVLVVDRDGRCLLATPGADARLTGDRLLDGDRRLREPTLAALAGDAFRTDQALTLVAPVGMPPRPTAAVRSTDPDGPVSGPVLMVEAVPLGRPPFACALLLRAPPAADPMAAARELVQTLSHELKTPLIHAQHAVEVLTQYHVPEDPEFALAVERGARAVRHIAALVRDLVDWLQMDAPQHLRLDRRSTALPELLEGLVDTYSLLAAGRGQNLALEIEPAAATLPALLLDEPLISRAIGNLVDNALKYAPPPGPVLVRLRRAGSLAIVEVADEGPGIPMADQARIFQPFVRLPAARAADGTGSGLGLSLAQRIARAHGATLSVDSGPGRGSRFRLSLLLPPGRHGPPAPDDDRTAA
ncbi:MAG TPA: HAMP domain-containing sensor histidine kinase [Candidatus Dormibacteraeota bacterium]|nr:HAMP domain-containing sensor histidine kinase [Candidatus Dormibacteraeota bacterium]